MGPGGLVAVPAGGVLLAVPYLAGGWRVRLKGKCRLCRGAVVLLESGAWVHSGFGWFKHAGMVFDRARASRQADYALAGPSRGGGK